MNEEQESMSKEEFEVFMAVMEARRSEEEEARRFCVRLALVGVVFFLVMVGLLVLAFR